MNPEIFHTPVLVDQVLTYLITNPSGSYVDGTVGGGGHSLAILKNLDLNGKLIGIDWDKDAILQARKQLQKYGKQASIVLGNFANPTDILNSLGINQVDGFLLDLGVSSYQINEIERGFGYMVDGPLDMRMSLDTAITAQEIVNTYSAEELERIFKEFGEERRAQRIAKSIIRERQKKQITTSQELAVIIESVVPFHNRIKSLARIFQALRIRVNKELENLQSFLRQSLSLLKSRGRLVIISYHSLEDRLVKNFFVEQGISCVCPPELPVCICGKKPTLRLLTRKVVTPSKEEVRLNPRSRSAKLRAAEKVE